jgi:hypothetical protein
MDIQTLGLDASEGKSEGYMREPALLILKS